MLVPYVFCFLFFSLSPFVVSMSSYLIYFPPRLVISLHVPDSLHSSSSQYTIFFLIHFFPLFAPVFRRAFFFLYIFVVFLPVPFFLPRLSVITSLSLVWLFFFTLIYLPPPFVFIFFGSRSHSFPSTIFLLFILRDRHKPNDFTCRSFVFPLLFFDLVYCIHLGLPFYLLLIVT